MDKLSFRCLLDLSVEMFRNSLYITHFNAHLEFRNEVQAEDLPLEFRSKYIILNAARLPENNTEG